MSPTAAQLSSHSRTSWISIGARLALHVDEREAEGGVRHHQITGVGSCRVSS
jgi:hypothetical protein